MLFAAQFGISYFCIYEVEWLGWDLVEPVTYTVAQGLFVLGLLYTLKYLGHSTQYVSLDQFFKGKALKRMYSKLGLDADRLEFLKAELKRTEEEILLCEAQRYS